jgi:Phage phiEco32-like COOH.NH2 ligase-type 2
MRLGADPEVFLQDREGTPRSAIGYINADKWNPLQIPNMPKGYTLQEDNVSLEYGIPPASSAEEFIAHINNVMKASLPYINGLNFSKLSCIIFPNEEMMRPEAHMFGCEPDFNAWTGKENAPPSPPHPLMRSAGGHIHVETKKDAGTVIRAMDLFLGVPSVLMDNGEQRKQLYGSAGAHRVKKYGVEYRTLSNFWIFEDKFIKWAWDNSQRAVDCDFDVMVEEQRILAAINNNDKKVAEQLINDYKLEVV